MSVSNASQQKTNVTEQQYNSDTQKLLSNWLTYFKISGSNFGQKGYQKFHNWRDEQIKLHGIEPILVD